MISGACREFPVERLRVRFHNVFGGGDLLDPSSEAT
jgi:hypothetical protein